MATTPKTWIKQNSTTLYFVLTYFLSWSVMIPVALSARGILEQQVNPAWYYLASFGPMASALLVTGLADGWPGIRRLLGGLARWRVGSGYVFFSLGAPVVFFVIAMLIQLAISGNLPDWRLLGEVDYLPKTGLLGAIVVWFFTYGLGEEVGWRGFALPHLQKKYSARSAALILGGLWAAWHLPAFFFRDTYMEMGVLGFPMLLISVTCASVILAWLYNSTKGSLLMVVLFHALFNWLSVSEAGGQYVAILMGAAAVFWAVRVINVYGPANLSSVERQMA